MLRNKINSRATSDLNTGFATNPSNVGGRFINKDGSANIEKRGLSFFDGISWYHTMLQMSRWKFFVILFCFFALVNLIFATIYYGIGVENLDGIDGSASELSKFGKAYFFSAQTFTTVGYGHISPNGFITSAISATEALVGLLSFAIATGLFYGRFSKPAAYIKFSDNAVISPYRDLTALMVRLTPFKNTNLLDAEAKMTMGMDVEENGVKQYKFYNLNLELTRINALTLSWTIVHPITEESPLWGFSKEDFLQNNGEILLYIKTFDDLYSTTVSARTSYTFVEIVYGAKFEMMYSENRDDSKTILHIDKLNSFYSIDLP